MLTTGIFDLSEKIIDFFDIKRFIFQLRSLPASCKHMTLKRKLSNRIGKNNTQCNICVNGLNNPRIGFKTKSRSNNCLK